MTAASKRNVAQPGYGHEARRWRRLAAIISSLALAAALLTTGVVGAAEQPVVVSAPIPNNWLLLGDSVAHSFSSALKAEAMKHGIKLNQRTRPGCGMISAIPVNEDGSVIPWGPSCARGTVPYLDGAINQFEPNVVIWNSSWEGADHLFDGQLLAIGTPAGDGALILAIEDSIAHLTRNGARVLLVNDAPRTPFNNIGLAAPPDLIRRQERLNQILAQIAEAHGEDVDLVDLEGIVCPKGPPCPSWVDGVPLRPRDGSHFEGFGPGWLAPRLYTAIVDALTQGPTSPVRFD